MGAVAATEPWHARTREHLLVATNWRVSSSDLPPAAPLFWAHYEAAYTAPHARAAHTPWERRVVADRAASPATIIVAPYTEHKGGGYAGTDGGASARDVRYFFGGHTSRRHRGYHVRLAARPPRDRRATAARPPRDRHATSTQVRWSLFHRREAELPNRTVLVADPLEPAVKVRAAPTISCLRMHACMRHGWPSGACRQGEPPPQ